MDDSDTDSVIRPASAATTLPALISFVDPERRYRSANGAWEIWFGISPPELYGKFVRDFVGETRFQAISPLIDQALRRNQVTFETEISTLAHGIRQSQVAYVPQAGSDGAVSGFHALVIDITKLKNIQKVLRESEALYQSLVDNLPMCLLRKNRDLRMSFANAEFFRYSGLKPEDILGKSDFDLFPPELAVKYRQDDQRVLETGETLSDIEAHRTPSGEQKYVQVHKSPVRDANGIVVGVRVLFWDVSDRKLAEEQVRESMARKRAIFESALDSIVIADPQGRIVDFNRAAEKTLGYRRADILLQNLDELLFPKTSNPRARESLDRVETQEGLGSMLGQRLETTVVRKNGELFDVEMTMQRIPMSGRSMIAVFLHDITARKQAQRELAEKNNDLETLLYVTSHDWRKPLRSIESFARMISDRYSDKLDEKGQDFLRRIAEGTRRVDRLIEDVLMLSRAQRSLEPIDNLPSSHLVDEVLKQLDGKIEPTQARIHVADDLPMLRVDRRWARQAIYNLVANALKFARPGEPPQVDIVRYSPRESEMPGIGIEVHDRGIGVSAADTERIFGLFQLAVGREIDGTGAGLVIVRQVAVRHGGNAWVRARDGGGSEFVLSFGQ